MFTFSVIDHGIIKKFKDKAPKGKYSYVISKLMQGYADGRFRVDT